MSHRDGDPQAAQVSNKLFNDAILSQITLSPPPTKGKGDRLDAVRAFLSRHPELAQATADALNRNVANGAKLPTPQLLEPLRSPRALLKKE